MRQLTLLISLFISTPLLAQGHTYLFAYFNNNGQDGLHLAYSNDGFKWTALRNDSAFVKPAVGNDKLMRDPCIIKGGDGLFHMVWTVSWKEKGIGYASSKDLIRWSEQQYIPVMEHEPTAMNAWAPEIIYNDKKKEYMIYWATSILGRFPGTDSTGDNGYNHRIYYTITKDFKNFSKAKILYDQGFDVIDATIQKSGKQYIMFLKNETKRPVPEKNIRIATSDKLTEGYSAPSKPITGNYWAEGPTAFKIGNDWIVYFDKYRDHTYGAVTSSDLKNWTDISDKIILPKGIKHGTILEISAEELNVLKSQK